MTKSRFDPKEDEPYGTCTTCGLELATKELSREHLDTTFAEALARRPWGTGLDSDSRGSHSVRITNPPRADRIHSAIESLVDDAIREAIEAVDGLVEDGQLTRAEATKAIARWDDFEEAWSDAGFATEDEPSSDADASTRVKEDA